MYLVPGTATFTSSDPDHLPCPSWELLALHAACAKVAHFSGAGEYINKFDCDADDMNALGTDGGSSAILTRALLKSFSARQRWHVKQGVFERLLLT